MKHLVLTLPMVGLTMLLSGKASAQTPGGFAEQGRFIISAERLFGLNFYAGHYEQNNREINNSGTHVGLLWNNALGSNDVVINPYKVPRLAFDYAVIPHLTIGGSLGFASSSGKRKEPNLNEQDTIDTTLFAFAPRVGYVFGFTNLLGLWLRGGLTYYHLTFGLDDRASLSGFGLNLEAALVFAVLPNVGITLTPSFDIPLTGSVSQDNEPNATYTVRNIGINGGLFLHF